MQRINLNEIKILPLDVKNADDVINIQNNLNMEVIQYNVFYMRDELLQDINNVINEVTKTKPEVQKNNVKQILFTTFIIK